MFFDLQEWNIQPRAHACAGTGKQFEAGETVYSALFFENGAYIRNDYCAEAWSGRDESRVPLSMWQNEYEPPAAAPVEAIKKDDAESLLRRLVKENDPAKGNMVYILAVMLERKKILKPLDKQKNGEQTLLIYEHVPSGESWIIPDPELKLEQIGAVQTQVSSLLTAEVTA